MRRSSWRLQLLPLLVAFAGIATVDAQTVESSATISSVGLTPSSSGNSIPPPSTNTTASTQSTPTPAPTSIESAAPTEAQTEPVNQIPIIAATFVSFPIPEETPIPGAFPVLDPSNPPPVGSRLIPDFGPAWQAAYQKAKAKIATFTLEDKVNVTTGVGWMGGRCVGNIPRVPFNSSDGNGWPGLCLEDSPLGVRFADFVTAFPAGINAATSWNRRLIRHRGLLMGREFKGKGVHIALGPMMNMGRVAQAGRNWEGFGADPFLAGEAAYETVLGLQEGGVQACAKHLVNNEQEFKRSQSTSDVDDRTQHEIYLHPFLRSIMAGVSTIMCSYNLINGTYACENSKILNEIIKGEFGFQGSIMSDWGAQHSTMSAVTGLDMSMPGDITFSSGTSYWGPTLVQFVKNGTIPEARVDDMAIRILAGYYLLQQDSPSFPPVSFDAFRPDDEGLNDHIDVQEDHHELVRELGAGSIVLLKNKNGALPLGRHPHHGSAAKQAERSIVLVGSGAGPGRAGPNQFPDQGGSDGVLAMGWGSGTANFTYLVSPLDAIQRRAREFRTSVSWLLDDFDRPRAGNMARFKSAALVFLSSDSGEEYITVDGNRGDRNNLTAWHGGDELVLSVAAQNNNTIVVVSSVGPLILEPWIEHENVTAVLWAGLLGQETGESIADVLYGTWNPSARLPYTIAKRVGDYSAQLALGGGPGVLKIPYTEGLEIDYRGFDARNITPRFEFGFGLSYTTFEYSQISVVKLPHGDGFDAEQIGSWETGEATPAGEGMSRAFWLHRPAYEVSFVVKNTGGSFGGDIPQLYVNFPPSSGEPPSVLKGFANTELAPGQSKPVTITLSRYDLSIWDVERQGWRKPDGVIGVTVARSSRDGRLKGSVPV